MIYFIRLLSLAILFVIIGSARRASFDDGLDLFVKFPVTQRINGQIRFNYLYDTVNISFAGDLNIYKVYGLLDFYTDQEVFKNKPVFIFKNGETQGYFFSDTGQIVYQLCSVDSFLNARAYNGIDINVSNGGWKKDKSFFIRDTLVEKYVPPVFETGISTIDSAIFYSSNLLHGHKFSFSKSAKTTDEKTIFRFRLITGEKKIP